MPESEGMPCRIPVAIFRIKKSAVWKHVHAVVGQGPRTFMFACACMHACMHAHANIIMWYNSCRDSRDHMVLQQYRQFSEIYCRHSVH